MSIKKVRIQNYKGLEDLEFEPSRINIFVGRNNTGKSSALEAVALTLSATNGFVDALGEDMLSHITKRRMPEQWTKGLNPIKYFVILGKGEGHVQVEIDGKSLRLDLQYLEKGVPESDAGDKFFEFLEVYSWGKTFKDFEDIVYISMRARLKKESFFRDAFDRKRAKIKEEITPTPKLFIVGRLSKSIISEVAYASVPAKELEDAVDSSGNAYAVDKSQREELKRFDVLLEHNEAIPILFRMSSVNEAKEVKRMLGELVRENKHEEAIQLIRTEVEYFKDVREVGGELLCSLTTGTVPLSFLGDGFLALLNISFMSVLADTVFIEEPETCLHPGFLDVAARQIVNSAERTEFFIATHNAEFLEYLLKAGKDHLELFRFVRLHRMPDGELSYEILTGEEATEEIFEIKTDLRGV